MAFQTTHKTIRRHHYEPSRFINNDSLSTLSSVDDGPHVLRVPTMLMIALTCGIGGQVFVFQHPKRNYKIDMARLQLVWASIFSHGAAYLLSLGITKSQSSLIWAIAPICGAVVQPIVGAIADGNSRWGRRRPFILGGMIGVIVSLITLAWVSDIMRVLAYALHLRSHENITTATQIGTIISVTLLNLSMQPLQSGLRALIVEFCPLEQQNLASAWAGRFTGIGNILGYILGSLPLGQDNEAWRFRFLSLTSASILMITVLITTYFVREDDAVEQDSDGQSLVLRAFRDVKESWSSMSLKARRVCFIQFFSWLGWFGFLFYSTSYVGRLYVTESRRRGVEHFDLLTDTGIRLGTFASLLSAISALATTIVAPHVASKTSALSVTERALLAGLKARIGSGRWLEKHRIWTASHLLYAMCTFCTIFVSSTNTAILLIALTGISWGITQWVPFALLGEEIASHEADLRTEKGSQHWHTSQSGAIMGVHNAAISIPQIIAALGTSVIFWVFEGSRPGEVDGVAWVLRASGATALIAAYFAWRL